jgi:hypothetical protein
MSNPSMTLAVTHRRALGGVLLLLLTLGLVAMALAADSMLLAMIASAAEAPAKGDHYTLSGTRVGVYNLAGQLRVEPATGKTVEVDVARSGRMP